jgi:hypothetical protein
VIRFGALAKGSLIFRAVLHVLEIRPRKFYATWHSFISVARSKGCNLKWVAEHCGTSVEMIEKSYGKFIADDGAAPLIRSLAGAKMHTHVHTLVANEGNVAETKVVPGGIEQLTRRGAKSAQLSKVSKTSRDSHETMGSVPVPKTAPKGRGRGRKFKPV